METKKVQLRFRAVNKDIFEAILSGAKKIETRAASSKFAHLKAGDTIVLVCGKEKREKTIKKVKVFQTISELVSEYKVSDINPFCQNEQELTDMYYSFPGYKEKIAKYGLIAMEFI